MSGREIAILNLSDKSYSEGKVNAIINSMTNNEFIEPISATGFWALKSWEYESSYHIDLIKKVFQTQNKPLSSREIFSEVCAKRPDLTLPNIRAYLYYNKNIFSQIDSDLFIINAWKKKYSKEVYKYQRQKNAQKSFDELVINSINTKGKLTLNKIVIILKEHNLSLSEGRTRDKLNNISGISKIKKNNKYFYYINNKDNTVGIEFLNKIMNIFSEVKNGIENRRADVQLKDGNIPKKETDIQVVLYENMRGYFFKEDIDVTREAFNGSGPVDFKFSSGFNLKAFLELKLASNPNLYNGLEAQLTQYMGSECVKYGIFLVIVFTDCEMSKIDNIKLKIKELEEKYNMIIQFQYIDARGNKKSASKLKPGEENIIKTLIT